MQQGVAGKAFRDHGELREGPLTEDSKGAPSNSRSAVLEMEGMGSSESISMTINNFFGRENLHKVKGSVN